MLGQDFCLLKKTFNVLHIIRVHQGLQTKLFDVQLTGRRLNTLTFAATAIMLN